MAEGARNTEPSLRDSALQYLDGLYAYAMKLARNQAEAEDLVQETDVRAMRAFERLRPGTNLKSWFERESVLVRRLRSAIDRSANGSYGICMQCEEEIAPKRLSAMPSSEICIDCQHTTENQAIKRERRPWFDDRSEAG